MQSVRHYWMLLPLRAWMFCVSWMKRQQQLWHMESTSKIFLLLKRNPGMWCLWIVVMRHFRFLLVLSTKANWRYSKIFSLYHMFIKQYSMYYIWFCLLRFSVFGFVCSHSLKKIGGLYIKRSVCARGRSVVIRICWELDCLPLYIWWEQAC